LVRDFVTADIPFNVDLVRQVRWPGQVAETEFKTPPGSGFLLLDLADPAMIRCRWAMADRFVCHSPCRCIDGADDNYVSR